MTLRFYFDEDSMNRRLVDALRQQTVDLLTAREAGMVPATDEDHLQPAASDRRVLYSFNVKDFSKIHTLWLSSGVTHAGIVVATQQQFGIGEQLRRLLHLINAVSAQEMQDRLEFLQNW